MDRIKPIGQLGLVMAFYYLGTILSRWVSTWIVLPGSIVGMMLLFLSLLCGIVKLKHVDTVSHFFLRNMGFFFIPLGVSLIDSYKDIQAILWQVSLLLVVSNILVMGITGRVVAWVMSRDVKKEEVRA